LKRAGLGLVMVLALVLAPSCSTVSPFVVSGESLDAAGRSFEATNSVMETAVRQGAISVDQYKTWRGFGMGFQLAFPAARQAWESARKANDVAGEHDAEALIRSLVGELGALTESVTRAVQGFIAMGANNGGGKR
jgi:hypothetical protein